MQPFFDGQLNKEDGTAGPPNVSNRGIFLINMYHLVMAVLATASIGWLMTLEAFPRACSSLEILWIRYAIISGRFLVILPSFMAIRGAGLLINSGWEDTRGWQTARNDRKWPKKGSKTLDKARRTMTGLTGSSRMEQSYNWYNARPHICPRFVQDLWVHIKGMPEN